MSRRDHSLEDNVESSGSSSAFRYRLGGDGFVFRAGNGVCSHACPAPGERQEGRPGGLVVEHTGYR